MDFPRVGTARPRRPHRFGVRSTAVVGYSAIMQFEGGITMCKTLNTAEHCNLPVRDWPELLPPRTHRAHFVRLAASSPTCSATTAIGSNRIRLQHNNNPESTPCRTIPRPMARGSTRQRRPSRPLQRRRPWPSRRRILLADADEILTRPAGSTTERHGHQRQLLVPMERRCCRQSPSNLGRKLSRCAQPQQPADVRAPETVPRLAV